jgi:hypothetical protein
MTRYIVLAATDSIGSRIAFCSIAMVIGSILIAIGRSNIKTQTAEESGQRRTVNKLFGASNTYVGRKAVMMGWMRVVLGCAAIIFGIVFLFVGPFLAKD